MQTFSLVFIILFSILLFNGSHADYRGDIEIPTDVSEASDDNFDSFVNSFSADSSARHRDDEEDSPNSSPQFQDPDEGTADATSIENRGSDVGGNILNFKPNLPEPVYIGLTRTFYQNKFGFLMLYMNGKLLGTVSARNRFKMLRIYASKGDVLAVYGSYTLGHDGIAMIVKIGKTNYKTGGRGYKAISAFNSSTWNHPSYQACSWKRAINLDMPPSTTVSNANYVWADSNEDPSYLRFVIGGEHCSSSPVPSSIPQPSRRPKRSPRPRPSASHRPQLSPFPNPSPTLRHSPRPVRSHLPLLSAPPVPIPSMPVAMKPCKCKQVSDAPEGLCFEFSTLGFKNGKKILNKAKCLKRKCEPRYECVGNGAPFTSRCMLKVAKFKVVMVKRLFQGIYVCKQVALKKPVTFLVPYEI